MGSIPNLKFIIENRRSVTVSASGRPDSLFRRASSHCDIISKLSNGPGRPGSTVPPAADSTVTVAVLHGTSEPAEPGTRPSDRPGGPACRRYRVLSTTEYAAARPPPCQTVTGSVCRAAAAAGYGTVRRMSSTVVLIIGRSESEPEPRSVYFKSETVPGVTRDLSDSYSSSTVPSAAAFHQIVFQPEHPGPAVTAPGLQAAKLLIKLTYAYYDHQPPSDGQPVLRRYYGTSAAGPDRAAAARFPPGNGRTDH
eukprot:483149-Hanusia_phi.AAC.1